MTLSLGVSETPKNFAEDIAKVVSAPKSIKVIDYSTGMMNEGRENQRPWANLIVVDPKLFAQFESIGQERHCPTFKVKIKGYLGEDLTALIDKEIIFKEYEVGFLFDKFKQPIGLALVLDLADISVK